MMSLANKIAAILGIILSVYVLYTVSSYPKDQIVQVGPDFFPRMLAIGLIFFCFILLVTSHRGSKKPAKKIDPNHHDEFHFSFKDAGIRRAAISLFLTIAYCLLLDPFGFILTSIVYLLCLMLLLKERRYVQMVIVAISVTTVVYLIFKEFLSITLPLGTFYGY